MRFRSLSPARLPGGLLALAGAGVILRLTLYPDPPQTAFAALTPFSCLVCGERGGADVVLNVLVFIPMAAGLRAFGWSWGRVVLFSAALSMVVESLQYGVIPGRDASLSDLLTNTTGGIIGGWIGARFAPIFAPGRALARQLFLGGIAFWLATTGAAAVAMRPWVAGGWLRNECTRSRTTPHRFIGTVRSMTIDSAPLPCDAEVKSAPPVLLALRRGEVRIDVTMNSVPATRGQRVISVLQSESGFALMLAQDGHSAAFTTPARANRFRLYSPVLRLPSAFPAQEGVPVEIAAGMHATRIWVQASRPGFRKRVDLALSPSFGWSLLLPWGLQEGGRLRVVTGLWIAGLLLPAAFWAGFLARPLQGLGGLAIAVAGGLALLPWLTGYAPVHWSEWLAAGLAIGLGWALHRLAAYLQSRCGSPSTSAYSSP